MMKHRNIYAICLLATLLVASCSQQTANQNAASNVDEGASKVVDKADSADQAQNADLVNVPAPDAKLVLADIYKQEVKEVAGDQLSDGRYVSYWNGKQFLLKGKNYFVAFTESTPPSEIEYPTPEDKVTISQATYEFVDNQWQLKKVQADVGQFGGNNKAPMADTEQKAQSFLSPSGKYFLALPSFQTAMAGISLSSLELFVFSEKETSWQYLGRADSGSDNSAGCAREADSTSPIKCATSTGNIDFTILENEEWPLLKVQMKGTAVGADGKIFELSPKDAREYRYDAKSSVYVEAKR
ncbi:MAG: hypothetical protein ACREPB_05620 [Arenimonas sp.]